MKKFGKKDLAQSQPESEASICCLNSDLLIPDDCLDHKNAGKKGLVNQMDIRKHFMHFSNLSMPLRGTLLLPRDRNVLEDFPSKLKGLNMNL